MSGQPLDPLSEQMALCLAEGWGLALRDYAALPFGADSGAETYWVRTPASIFFLKRIHGHFTEATARAALFLKEATGLASIVAPLATCRGLCSYNAYGANWLLYPYIE